MTLCAIWSRSNPTLGPQLVMATDSRITGGLTYDHGTKLSVFNRRDCALCWHGDTTFPYSFTANARNDIDFSDALSTRGTSIGGVAARLVLIFNQLWDANLGDPNSMFKTDRFEFIFGGYDHLLRDVDAWVFEQDAADHLRFRQRQLTASQLQQGYFAGSGAAAAQQFIANNQGTSPYAALCAVINDQNEAHVGGYPQIVTVDRRGGEAIGVVDAGRRYLFGKLVNSSGHWTQTRYIPLNAPDV